MPTTDWVWVRLPVSSKARAMPKSITLMSPSGVSMTLAGLMSRWTMPLRWLYSSGPSTPAVTSRASRIVRLPWVEMTSRSVCPSTYSMTMKGTCMVEPPDSEKTSSPES